jgi:hypothetical protein
VEIEPPGQQIVPDRNCLWDAPMIAVQLDESTAHGQPRQMFQQQTALATSAEAKFTDELFIACPLTGRALDVAYQFTVSHNGGSGSGKRSSLNHIKSHTHRKDFANRVQFSSNHV